MNFQTLLTVETADTYIDIALRAARTNKRSLNARDAKKAELEQVNTINKSLSSHLLKIVKSFPSINHMSEFYINLTKLTVGTGKLKKSLGAVQWAVSSVRKMSGRYTVMMKKSKDKNTSEKLRKEYYGRVTSIVKQINKELKNLEDSRKIMKGFPTIKQKYYTVAIAGYPNVGKSSLLRKLTLATPNVRNYSFTTKSLNIGYMGGVQLIDTPGAFDRNVEDMNPIEKQAYLAIKYAAELVLFIIDPSESCGYDVKTQQKLANRVKKLQETIVIYNKSDLVDSDGLSISCTTGKGISSIKKLIKKHKSESQNKYN